MRVSDPKQVSQASGLLSQETRNREYAKYVGISVAKVFRDEGISGKFRDRPEVQKMLEFLKNKKPGVQYVVLIDDISRLARDVRVHFDLRDALEEVGALLDSPTMRFKVVRDADGNLSEGMYALNAQHYRESSRNHTQPEVVTTHGWLKW